MLPIAGKTAGLFGLTFFGHSGVTGGCSRLKNSKIKNIFFLSRATSVPSASFKIFSVIHYYEQAVILFLTV